MWLVFTDLDGTLLDERYSFAAAQPALDRLRRHNTPIVFVTSKTRAEVEYWRREMDNQHPFIVENGGALFVPRQYFTFQPAAAVEHGAYAVIEFGARYGELVEALDQATRESGCRVLAFHCMTEEEVGRACGLPREQAGLARMREFDEPFRILEGDAERLTQAIERRGKRWTKGGRFYHILGESDKGAAVSTAIALYRRRYPAVETIGLGDAPNDETFLRVVDRPVMLQSPAGPAAWNQAILEMIPE